MCRLAEVPSGAALRVEFSGLEVAITRVGQEVLAVEDICSHAAFPLSDGDIDGCTIECDLHGSRFDLRTGKPSGPPATEPVRTFPVAVVDGDVYLELEN